MLVTAFRDRVEIDYCPSCWGIWLDRGELNALIDQSKLPPLSTLPTRDPGESSSVAETSQSALVVVA
jgi:Zn-finger nucleic acid-binding protein